MMERPDWPIIVFGAFCSITFIQIIYYLYFFRRLAFRRNDSSISYQQPSVSVIVCARDEAANLAKNLPGLLVQEFTGTHELLLVNDNSLDESKYLLEALQKDFPQLHIIELKQEAQFIPGKKFPLSIGIKTAKHDVVLLTDADCVPASEFWMHNMISPFEEGTEIVLGYGAYYKRKGLLNRIIRFETFHTGVQYLSYALAGLPYMGTGRNLAYKKDVFFRNKGFSAHNHLPGGDDDLFINATANGRNTKVVTDKSAFTLSEPKKTWKEWKKQKQRHFTTARLYKAKHRFLLGLYALTHFLFYPAFIAALLLFRWELAVGVFLLRFIIQGVIWYNAMEKLDEKDLWKWFWAFDIFMFFYYLIFTPALWKKPRVNWK
ncbi:MAG TPA: glycosyltransferase [Agriterribacter sp.]|nr:glycosyltransferase [Agriterribacter sp.]HRQ50098.1 glycosyltransferase [Agriterribacter sp.]